MTTPEPDRELAPRAPVAAKRRGRTRRPTRYSHAGQPTKFDEAKAAAICELLKAGNFMTHAAAAVGVNVDTVREWAKADAEFGAQLDQSRALAVVGLVGDIRIATTGGGEAHQDARALQWLLAKLAPLTHGESSRASRDKADAELDAAESRRLTEKLLRRKLKAEIAALDKGIAVGVSLSGDQFDSLFARHFGQLPGRAEVVVNNNTSLPATNVPGRFDAE